MLGPSLQLNKDEEGNIEFRGNSSGAVFLQSVSGQLGVESYGGPPVRGEPFSSPSRLQHKISTSTSSTKSKHRSKIQSDSDVTLPNGQSQESGDLNEEADEIQLPDYHTACELTRLCFNNACSIIQFVHQPSFNKQLEDYYANDDDCSTDENFLSVLYSSMAVGCLFVGTIVGHLGIEEPRIRAFQYFQASKSLVDPLDRANTGILQTLLCQILFLQSTSNMSTCWTYLGTALRCAQRMGLHRKYDDSFSSAEIQLRSKMFYSIRNVEIFLHAILGLPRAIAEEDYDQSPPLEIEDKDFEAASTNGQKQGKAQRICSIVAFNEYTKLMTIMAAIVRRCYPIVAPNGPSPVCVSLDTIESLSNRLEAWSKALPQLLQPTTKLHDLDLETYRQSRLLRYAYYHAYILLHRPYLHYLSANEPELKEFRKCGEKARSAAIGVLQLTEELFISEPTAFGHWFSIYATFFGGTILLYCVTRERPIGRDRAECLHYIEIAKQAIDLCSKCSLAAERCHKLLSELAKQVPTQDSIRDAASKTFDVVNERFSVEKDKSPGEKDEVQVDESVKTKATVAWSRTVEGAGQGSQPTKGHRKTKSRQRNSISVTPNHSTITAYPQPQSNYKQQLRQPAADQTPSQANPYFDPNDPLGFQSHHMFSYDNGKNHMQDTYQPNIVQPGFQDYSSMLQAPPQIHPSQLLQTLAMDQHAYGTQKADFSPNQWQYYGDPNGMGNLGDLPMVNHDGMSTMDESYIFPNYQSELYPGQP
ncbi:protein of unknown function [Taphrina deformans PYCC 5710]|uniref:Xylanolytic transcriptional activator regulatory domain-containing protein n=1 Tax=Taphrina deformans (strain PYCC 5710 / ATCC 11124 / CBS 356.35 / IMI 108563 / JCM 9778 / NBRC 8474) TaxID=1097556 RepID=R4XDM6_TAPDE|nr:protein of unknown function [Taphrina deformans PYCC 5710]|eukprot:CCG83711.1 protein of unknown function [Taphrina deformans PYCC 5710]